ncbi:MAG: LCP family protein [Limnochordales bacterium]
MERSPEQLEQQLKELEARRARRRARRRRQAATALVVTLAALALAFLTAYITYQRGMRGLGVSGTAVDASSGTDPARRVTVLLIGIDDASLGAARTDTLMLASFDPRTGQAAVLSTPRDTRVEIPGRAGYHRINTAYTLGGPELAVRTVERLLGVDIDHYLVVDFAGFARVIDLLGGVELVVDKPMRYDDYAQGLHIDLRPGRQVLNGEQALHYVRFRADGLGDVALVDPVREVYGGRVQRQLEFVRRVAERAMGVQALPRLPQLVPELLAMVQTDIGIDRALALAVSARRLDIEQLETAVLPGTGMYIGGASYWVHDPARTQTLVKRLILGERVPTATVLNGAGSAGLAARAAALLRQHGYEVVRIGNAPDGFRYEQTQIIVHRPGLPVDQLARLVGGQVSVAVEAAQAGTQGPGVAAADGSPAAEADVTVIVGRDFSG